MSSNFTSNCAGNTKCLECPIELLGEADDREWVGKIVQAVLSDPANAELGQASITEVNRVVMDRAASLGHYTHCGAALGAVMLGIDNRCVVF